MTTDRYSIIIPAYNETQRIGHALDQIVAWVRQEALAAEILVVDDGSRDNTPDLVREYASRHPIIRLVSNPGNRGKGYSVRHGMREATGNTLLFTDTDLSAPITEAAKLFRELEGGAGVAIGSRWLQRESQTTRQPFYRQLGGRVFNLWLRVVLNLPFKDTQCGFKAFNRPAADALFAAQRVEGWGFDAELLYLAGRFGFRTVEVPVQWADDARSKVNPYVDGLKIVTDVLRIRWNALTGKYPAKIARINSTSG